MSPEVTLEANSVSGLNNGTQDALLGGEPRH
jgi:hypothetical protein